MTSTSSISAILEPLLRENVKRMTPYSSARDEFKEHRDQMVYLDANENPYPSVVHRYPDPQQKDLKRRIAEIRNMRADQLLIGNGSDEVLDLIFRAFCEPNQDNVLCFPPTYGMYKVLAEVNAVECREVELDGNFQLRTQAALKACDASTKIIFICSPNNPSGNLIRKEEITILLDAFSGIVVIDEAYIDFSAEPGWLGVLDQYPRLVVIQTLSKAFGMAGIRMGLAFAHPELIGVLKKIKPPYNVNQLSIDYALEKLKDTANIQEQVSQLVKERESLSKALLQFSFVEEVFPSDANFLLIRVDNAAKRYEELLRKGIVVRNRSNQPLCKECLRITIGTMEENLKLLEAFNELSLSASTNI